MMAIAIQDRKRVTPELKSWLDDVEAYERTFKKWETRVEAILKRYRDESRSGQTIDANRAKFNVMWANVQTLVPATYSRTPQPDVARRFRDTDPVGRVAALILERGLEFEIQHYPYYRRAMKSCVLDRFLGGRGTSWVRYEPHLSDQPPLDDGEQITETIENEEETAQKIDYECTPVDYVHWRDFGHSIARTWGEVSRVWRKVYMRKAQLEERFGRDIAKLVPMDATPEDLKRQADYKPGYSEAACVYEGWDKEQGVAVWFSKSVKDLLDDKADPLGLEQFFPAPPPLFATLTNESLVPVPDFAIYQDQANELDLLADRIDGLIKALKVTGVYDASQPALARLFTEGGNNDLIPVKNWAAFADKNGLKGTIDIVDIQMISKTLNDSYAAFEQIKGQVDELLGIADIARGQTNPNETLGAQQLKTSYLNLRLKNMQNDVAQFATDILKIMAEIMCSNYQPETLAKMAAVEQFEPADQQYIEPALQMLKNEPLRNFRIEVHADSLVEIDEQKEKQSRVEFLQAIGAFIQQVSQGLSALAPNVAAPLAGLMMKLMKFGVTGFRIGKTIEGEIDAAADQIAQAIMNPPPPAPDPSMMVAQVKAQAEMQKMQGEQQMLPMKMQAEAHKAQLDMQTAAQKAQIEQGQMQAQGQHDMAKLTLDGQRMQMEVAKAHAMPQKPQGTPQGRPQ